jgi:hypothetical protein
LADEVRKVGQAKPVLNFGSFRLSGRPEGLPWAMRKAVGFAFLPGIDYSKVDEIDSKSLYMLVTANGQGNFRLGTFTSAYPLRGCLLFLELLINSATSVLHLIRICKVIAKSLFMELQI